MKLISCLTVCLALSACATDYVSQLNDPGLGRHAMHYSEENVDPAMLMDGIYASKLSNGSYSTAPSGAFCAAGRCSPQTPLWSSGWAP